MQQDGAVVTSPYKGSVNGYLREKFQDILATHGVDQ